MTVIVNCLGRSLVESISICMTFERAAALRHELMQLWPFPPFSPDHFLIEEICDVNFRCQYRTVCLISSFPLACRVVGKSSSECSMLTRVLVCLHWICLSPSLHGHLEQNCSCGAVELSNTQGFKDFSAENGSSGVFLVPVSELESWQDDCREKSWILLSYLRQRCFITQKKIVQPVYLIFFLLFLHFVCKI